MSGEVQLLETILLIEPVGREELCIVPRWIAVKPWRRTWSQQRVEQSLYDAVLASSENGMHEHLAQGAASTSSTDVRQPDGAQDTAAADQRKPKLPEARAVET
jgi:hypothetical protein